MYHNQFITGVGVPSCTKLEISSLGMVSGAIAGIDATRRTSEWSVRIFSPPFRMYSFLVGYYVDIHTCVCDIPHLQL